MAGTKLETLPLFIYFISLKADTKKVLWPALSVYLFTMAMKAYLEDAFCTAMKYGFIVLLHWR